MRMERTGAGADGSGPVFLHSMWRTGSSYLLSRFERSDRYLVFYEPFNGEIGSAKLRARAKADHERKRTTLRHPDSSTSYFDIYDSLDPQTGRPIWSFAKRRLPIHDVYNGLSADGTALLQACIRLAKVWGRTAVFGFCHSGLQVEQMRRTFAGRHAYLYRAPRDQFLSYSPLANDFFMPATVLQLLSAPRLAETARRVAPDIAAYPAPLLRLLSLAAPHRATMRVARRLSQSLDLATLYQLFYLSWTASNDHGRAACSLALSLESAERDPDCRSRFEREFAVSLDDLRYPRRNQDGGPIDFQTLEDSVRSMLSEMRGPDRSMFAASAP